MVERAIEGAVPVEEEDPFMPGRVTYTGVDGVGPSGSVRSTTESYDP